MVATEEPKADQISPAIAPPAQPRDSSASSSNATASPRGSVVAIGDKMANGALLSAASLPVSMVVHPVVQNETAKPATERFAGELSESFVTALARVESPPTPPGLKGALRGLLAFARGRPRREATTRMVAFEGFRSPLYDEKTERDRRYGTVYTVIEKRNAYVVRLEMPRRIPASALKETWGVGDEMPNYHYSLQLEDQVLSIRASVEQEAIRRLAYISSSFPPDFLTRIEFAQAVEGFVHRLANKVLEIIVFKLGAIRS